MEELPIERTVGLLERDIKQSVVGDTDGVAFLDIIAVQGITGIYETVMLPYDIVTECLGQEILQTSQNMIDVIVAAFKTKRLKTLQVYLNLRNVELAGAEPHAFDVIKEWEQGVRMVDDSPTIHP